MACVVEPKKGLLDIIPVVKRKRQEEAQRKHNEMTWMFPVKRDAIHKALAMSMGPDRIYSSGCHGGGGLTSPGQRVKFGDTKRYLRVKRSKGSVEVRFDIPRLKADVKHTSQLVRNHRYDQRVLKDSQLFL